MIKLIIVLLIGLVFEATGVVFLSKGLKQLDDPQPMGVAQILKIVRRGITNTNILAGVFFEAIFFVALLILLARSDVSFVWPLTALGFVITTLAAKFILHEEVTSLRWIGVLLIMIGAALITWTERTSPRKPSSRPEAIIMKI